jgi:hypothetical protein
LSYKIRRGGVALFWKKGVTLEPEILALNDIAYEKYTFFKKSGESFFVVRNVVGEKGVTELSLRLFKSVKPIFCNFTYASVKNMNEERAISEPDSEDGIRYRLDPESDHKYLMLTDVKGNQLYLTGCTVGYAGTGPHGTHEVLNKLGFKVPMRFIIAMREFVLSHPDNDREYQERLKEIDKQYNL